jgi:hypothetical protein
MATGKKTHLWFAGLINESLKDEPQAISGAV